MNEVRSQRKAKNETAEELVDIVKLIPLKQQELDALNVSISNAKKLFHINQELYSRAYIETMKHIDSIKKELEEYESIEIYDKVGENQKAKNEVAKKKAIVSDLNTEISQLESKQQQFLQEKQDFENYRKEIEEKIERKMHHIDKISKRQKAYAKLLESKANEQNG